MIEVPRYKEAPLPRSLKPDEVPPVLDSQQLAYLIMRVYNAGRLNYEAPIFEAYKKNFLEKRVECGRMSLEDANGKLEETKRKFQANSGNTLLDMVHAINDARLLREEREDDERKLGHGMVRLKIEGGDVGSMS